LGPALTSFAKDLFMANRNFYQFFYALENDPVFLWVKWKASNSAVSSKQYKEYGAGIDSIKKTATGKYQFILEDRYPFHMASMDDIESTSVIDFNSQLVKEDVNNATIPFVERGYHTAAGAFADPDASKYIYTTLVLKNSFVGRGG
jgi:hypothetical protein